MNHDDTRPSLSTATLDQIPASDRHCIVRCRTSWFSVPAVSVREITIAPELVTVPQCHRSLVGLCHLRSEFIPVIELESLLEVDSNSSASPNRKLMVIQGRSVWAALIDEAAAIESLEVLVAPEARTDDGQSSPVVGTAMYREKIVRVLDPNGIFHSAQQALERDWTRCANSQITPRTGSQH